MEAPSSEPPNRIDSRSTNNVETNNGIVESFETVHQENGGEPYCKVGYRQFLSIFFQSRGAPQMLFISTVLAIGTGSVLGLIPATLADRFAHLNHGFTGRCSDFAIKPPPCQWGSDDAQSAAAWSHVGLSAFLLLLNPVLGSWSDRHGRRRVILFSLAVSIVPAIVFLVLLQDPTMHPAWYYASYSLTGSVSYVGIVFAALSDVLPSELRSQAFGLLLSGFYGGYSLAPTLNLVVKNSSVAAATISFALIAMALFVAIVWLPETLPRCNNNEPASDETLALRIQANDSASEEVEEDNHEQSIVSRTTTSPQWTESWPSVATRPIREISILLRHRRLRMLTVGSFFAAMVYAADTTLVIYYVEETLDMQKSDIAIMTFVMGTAGILVQGGLLQHLIALFGEYPVLVISFLSGILHNFLYGVARAKGTIYVALIVSQLSKTNFPLLSSLSSKCVDEHEQGRVQSALFAVNAIANAIGPLSLEFVYHYSKHMSGIWASPGFMFIFAAFLYAVGTVVVALIPANPAETQRSQDQESNSISTTNADPAAIECTETSELLSDRMNMTEPLLASNA